MKNTILIGLLIAGCSTTPAPLDGPVEVGEPTEPFSQELDRLDREFEAYIEATALPSIGTPLVFALAAKQKSAAMTPLWSGYQSFESDEDPRIGGRARYKMAHILLNFGCEVATIQIEDELSPEVVEKTREGLNKNAQEWLGKSRKWASSATRAQGHYASKAAELEQALSDLTDPSQTCTSIDGWASSSRPKGEAGKVSKRACLERSGVPVPACVGPLSTACSEGDSHACYLFAKGEFKESPKAGRDAVPALSKVRGQLSSSEVYAEIQKHTGKIQTCYERELNENPSLGGRITFEWTIKTNGGVETVKEVNSTLGNAAVSKCVSGVIRQMKFPRPKGGEVIVIFPWMFSAK